jgi:hypothetical protein
VKYVDWVEVVRRENGQVRQSCSHLFRYLYCEIEQEARKTLSVKAAVAEVTRAQQWALRRHLRFADMAAERAPSLMPLLQLSDAVHSSQAAH